MKKALFGVFFLAACGEPYSNDDLLFVRSIPDRTQVMIDLPSKDQPMPGAVAQYYLQLVEASENVNRAIFDPLQTVDDISQNPPTYRDDDARAWGPIRTSSLAQITLYMARTATAGVRVPTATTTIVPITERFDFVLYGQAVGGGESFAVMTGGFVPLGEGGIGGITVDLDAFRRIEPRAPGRGQYSGAYDTRAGQTLLFAYDGPGGEGSLYKLVRAAGAVDFAALHRADLYSPGGEGVPSALEDAALVGHWQPDNRGRADVMYDGGDFAGPASGHECWDSEFRRVYFSASTPALGMDEGDAAACP